MRKMPSFAVFGAALCHRRSFLVGVITTKLISLLVRNYFRIDLVYVYEFEAYIFWLYGTFHAIIVASCSYDIVITVFVCWKNSP